MPDSPKLCTSCGQPLAEGRRLSICASCLTKGWQRSKSDEPAEGKTAAFEIPGYEITGELARGGMGIVYRARQRSPQREVAVKMLMPQIALDDLRERFRIEAKVMAELVHPGIMPIYQYGEHTGVPWISMALCGKGSLAARKGEYAGQWRRIAELMQSLSEAVAFAHARGVLHRDLKPGNVLFDDEGRAFLSDFGLAKIVSEHSDLTRTISLVGTPHYLAPELINNAGQATTASDVYALGAILYELLAGRPPFDGQNVAAILKQISENDPEPLTRIAGDGKSDSTRLIIPTGLAAIALKCLDKAPVRRYATAQALVDDLTRWLRNEPIVARPTSLPAKALLWCRRKPAMAAVSALLVLCVCAATCLLVDKNAQLRRSLDNAQRLRREALMGEARAVRASCDIQSRDVALKRLTEAAMIAEDLELRTEAATLLALPSLTKVNTIPRPTSLWGRLANKQMTAAADFTDAEAVRILELPSLREITRLPPGSGPPLYSFECFDREGSLIAYEQMPSAELVVMEWRAQQVLLRVPVEQNRYALFGPDSSLLTLDTARRMVRRFDLKKPGQAPVEWKVNDRMKAPQLFMFSPDGRWCVLRDKESYYLSICDPKTGAQKYSITAPTLLPAMCMSWRPGNEAVVVGYNQGSVMAYSLLDGALGKQALPGHFSPVRAVDWHPRGDLILTSSFDSRTRILHAATGQILAVQSANGAHSRFFNEGRNLLVDDISREEQVWHDLRLPAVCAEYVKPEIYSNNGRSFTGRMALIPPGSRLLLQCDASDTSVFDLASGKRLLRMPGDDVALSWDSVHHCLYTAGGKLARFWELREDAEGVVTFVQTDEVDLQNFQTSRPPDDQPHSVAWHPETGCFWFSTTGAIEVCKPGQGLIKRMEWNLRQTGTRKSQMAHITFSQNGRWAASSATETGLIAVIDTHSFETLFTMTDAFSFRPVFSSDDKALWVCGRNSIWRIATAGWKEEMKVAASTFRTTWPSTPDVSPGDGLLAVPNDRAIDLRDGHTGRLILQLKHPYGIPVSSVSFSEDGGLLACTGAGQISHVWNLHELASEFRRLGLHWEGPEIKAPPVARSVKNIRAQMQDKK